MKWSTRRSSPKGRLVTYLTYRLTNSDVPTSDHDDISGQIWDVLLGKLRFWNEEIGAKGRSIDESPEDIESGRVLSHLGRSGGFDSKPVLINWWSMRRSLVQTLVQAPTVIAGRTRQDCVTRRVQSTDKSADIQADKICTIPSEQCGGLYSGRENHGIVKHERNES